MKPASSPRSRGVTRILVVDGVTGAMRVATQDGLADLFAEGDLLVFNDAATLPASLSGRTAAGSEIELRLASPLTDARATAVLLGAGDYRTRTEDRAPPPRVLPGERLFFAAGLVADVVAVRPESPRLVEVALAVDGAVDASSVVAALYRAGRVVQYAHVPEPMALWDVQNVYAGRPWAVEMPSAGRVFGLPALLELRHRGVALASVTHAAGLSAVGDPAIDVLLPLPECFDVPEATWEAIAATRERGGRVIAIGTSAARALEGGARRGTRTGVTDLRLGPGVRRAIVDAVVTGIHETDTSHFALLEAFAPRAVLEQALARAEHEGMLGHEMGDVCLVWAPFASKSIGRDVPARAHRRTELKRTASYAKP